MYMKFQIKKTSMYSREEIEKGHSHYAACTPPSKGPSDSRVGRTKYMDILLGRDVTRCL